MYKRQVLIVEQGARGTSYGAMLADEIQRRYFDWLDQPVKRVTGGEASPSISKVLERAAFADTEEVIAGLNDVLADLGAVSYTHLSMFSACKPPAMPANMADSANTMVLSVCGR